MASAGFDRDVYPGDDIMNALRQTNLEWCGYYLFPAPSHTDGSWMGKRASLLQAGWGIAPIYLGQQIVGPGSHQTSGAQGTIDGNDAVGLMEEEKFPEGSYVYLDLENGPDMPPEQKAYVQSWCAAVTAGNYGPSVYVSHLLAADVQALWPAARIWVIKVTTTLPRPVPGPPYPDPDPSGSGFAGAFMWQCHQNCQISVPGQADALTVDLDTAIAHDPSAAAAG